MKGTRINFIRFALTVVSVAVVPAGADAALVPTRSRQVLRLARTSDPQTLDPARMLMQNDYVLIQLLHMPLLDTVDVTNLLRNAAREWRVSPDFRTYTFLLAPEIRFSNGRPVVAADYVYALERIIHPATAAPLAVYLLGIRGATNFVKARMEEQGERPHSQTAHVAGIRTPSLDTLLIELEKPDPTFAYVMACAVQSAVPREEVELRGREFDVHPVGSGPYVVEEWIRGVQLVLAPNAYYAGPQRRHFERIEIMIGGDESTHLMMFERGELDVASIEVEVGIPTADHRRLMRSSRWAQHLEQAPILNAMFVVLNTEMPPLDNPWIRQAINYAVNKPRRMRSENGRHQPARGIVPPLMPGYNPTLKGYPFDPEKAKALLAESGLAPPIPLTLWHPTDLEAGMVAQGIQEDLKAVGFAVNLKPVTVSELNTAATMRRKVQMAFTGWICVIPDPKDTLGMLFDGRTITDAGSVNMSFYNNAEVNRLLDEAATNVIWSARHALYQRAEEIIVGDAPYLFLSHRTCFALKQPWIKGRLLDPGFGLRLDRIWIER